MTPRTSRPTHWEFAARARKAERLVSEIHRQRRELRVTQTAMLECVSRWPDQSWRKLAISIGIIPPSEATIRAVLAMLSRAELVERLVDEHRVRTLDHERDTRRPELVEP